MPAKSVDADGRIYVGKASKPAYLTHKLANRHGIVTGATGTGKTVTLPALAEGFSRAGVPVFAADPASAKLPRGQQQDQAEQAPSGAGGWLGTIFGTNRKRGQRLTTGQYVTREVTRSAVGRMAGQVAADLGKSIGGKRGGTIGRAIVCGALGGILRR